MNKYFLLLKHFIAVIRHRGIFMTFRIAYHEFFFDWKYGTETRTYIENKNLQTNSANQVEGHKYSPLKIPLWKKVFDSGNFNFDKSCYIDFGCGKGRTLILAALSGFAEIIGIEYSKDLCEKSRENIASFKKRRNLSSVFKVLCLDAVDFEIPDNATTLVFFNPFSPIILEKVVQNIRVSLYNSPREIFIVYFSYSENHKALLSEYNIVTEFKKEKILVCKCGQKVT